MKQKATNLQYQEELRKILTKDKVQQVQPKMFKERKKMEEASEQAFSHKMKSATKNLKMEMESFTIDFGETLHLQRDKGELYIDKLELILNNTIRRKNLKNILF